MASSTESSKFFGRQHFQNGQNLYEAGIISFDVLCGFNGKILPTVMCNLLNA